MEAKLTTKPVEQVINAIRALDLDPIKFKLMNPEEGQGWSREYVDHIELAYKRFLTLLAIYPEETIAPSKDVDKFWHGHILDTLKYAEDCKNTFGYFLHHFPYFGMRGAEDAANLAAAAENMKRLSKLEFSDVQKSDAAGSASKSASAAFCGAIKANDAAFCGAAVKAEDAAFCGAIGAQGAAFCGAATKADDAAFCGAAVKAEDAAFCGAIGAQGAAFCGAATKADDAAFCGAAVKAEDAAFCGAIKADRAVFCGAITDEVVRKETARSVSDKLKVSVRPRLAAAL